ncbi:metal-sensing transcriptional repressor [Candidatus Cetobacterium colombiensis]|uniref:Copper-sensing transcriptional repressor CsoR n=1 Tax=Candidatus Cetobacterium colombiensis TaxID=3073100 RepID=A0ABU4WCT0_9FUSO|nr:metal-sensing transcriptional repressor [Candidatus Cetobacterium colombiensis]MDX8337334.1 metal-sensing transcriptional repressor [Candidatus Cetobacterium colombiensis]
MKTEKEKAVLMLKTCRGQIDATLKMIDDGRYCMDVVNQILAAEALLKKANKLIIKQHMEKCVKNAFDKVDIDEKMAEVIDVLNKVMK